ncbi:MAG: type II secretion system protein GspK [Candidatus Competibacteraceae bacterium]
MVIPTVRRQKGIVLVIVLWIITLLSVMAASFSYSMRTETLLTVHSVERAQARALAEAGIVYAMMQVLNPNPNQQQHPRWIDGEIREWRFGPALLRINATDVGGKVDLNRADRNLLGGLLQQAGVSEDDLDSVLDAIEDWRDPDDLRRLNGAESADYRAAGRALGPTNMPFTSVEELQQVLGITPVIFHQLAPWLTVHSYQPGIDPTIASATVLHAMPGVDPAVIDDYIAARAESLAEGQPPPPPPALGPYLSPSRGLAYHITVEAQLDSGVATSISTVISLQGSPTVRQVPR